jgi:hypothetical protein
MTTPNLARVRWAVRITLTLGVAASVTANILHARPNLISQAIAAWPPLALLLTVELISRVPVNRRSLSTVRLITTVAISAIAAWISYWHMAGVVARYGETGPSPYLMPFSVDGLIIVASICLVELGGQIRNRTAGSTIDNDHTTLPVEPSTTSEETTVDSVPAGGTSEPVELPQHLLPTARFSIVNHEQTTGRAITANELAARMSITPAIAGQLLATLAPAAVAGADRINGTPLGDNP